MRLGQNNGRSRGARSYYRAWLYAETRTVFTVEIAHQYYTSDTRRWSTPVSAILRGAKWIPADDPQRWRCRCRRTDPDQVRRLLAITAVYDDMKRADVTAIGGMDGQSLRHSVQWFNAEGPDGLIDRKAVNGGG